ncbi:hypothetical protein EVAR_765_1 [Eumeta japonica]|uniref:Uncharacterized protein n=1 Tax=Eumeta variegata TaxID=151549 RepID=A0A4C1SE52_EUMVA|nr:hypothetical protein EVAR_765_1 [Eumeta japonica]
MWKENETLQINGHRSLGRGANSAYSSRSIALAGDQSIKGGRPGEAALTSVPRAAAPPPRVADADTTTTIMMFNILGSVGMSLGVRVVSWEVVKVAERCGCGRGGQTGRRRALLGGCRTPGAAAGRVWWRVRHHLSRALETAAFTAPA